MVKIRVCSCKKGMLITRFLTLKYTLDKCTWLLLITIFNILPYLPLFSQNVHSWWRPVLKHDHEKQINASLSSALCTKPPLWGKLLRHPMVAWIAPFYRILLHWFICTIELFMNFCMYISQAYDKRIPTLPWWQTHTHTGIICSELVIWIWALYRETTRLCRNLG